MSVCDFVDPDTWSPNRKQPEISFFKVSATEIPCQCIEINRMFLIN